MRPFFRYLKPHRVALIPVVLASCLEMVFNAQIPMSVKFMIDRALLGRDQHLMFVILGLLAVSTVVVCLSSLGRDYLYAKIVTRVTSSLRARMFEHLQSLSLEFYTRREAGDLLSRFSNDMTCVENGLTAGVAWGLQPLLDLLLSAALVISLEWRLATFGLLLCPICVLGPRLLAKRATDASVGKQEHESRLLSTVQEALMAPALVRAFNLQAASINRFRDRNELLVGASLRVGFLTSLMERTATLGTLSLQVVVMAISGYLAFRGVISVGTFASFQALFVSLSYSFMYLAQYTPTLITAGGGLVRIEEILRETPKVADAPAATNLPSLAQAIEFRDVTFGYDPARPNLKHLDLRIRRGESVALVGASGSGKSTVLNLLLRFYDPDQGAVMVDGTDIRGVTQASHRAQMAVVFQESFLFNASIRENIAVARPAATLDEVMAAAKLAEIHDFIASLPAGYETLAGERGGRFSGGQRQRIAIARALLKDPAILVLDEATSALDAASEHAINQTLERAARGRTIISVTHRLSSTVSMDRVCLFDHGSLLEQGSHDELLRANGAYAELWRKQSGLRISAQEERATVDPAWLGELPLMKVVSADTLAEVALWFTTETFAEDRFIVRRGEPGDRFYILVRGSAEVTRTDDGESRQLAVLSDGDYFGEMALLSDQPRNASVRTLTPCVCLTLGRELFTRLLEREPELREHLRKIYQERVAQ